MKIKKQIIPNTCLLVRPRGTPSRYVAGIFTNWDNGNEPLYVNTESLSIKDAEKLRDWLSLAIEKVKNKPFPYK